MTDNWPFADPPNVAVITTASILSREDWIHYVSHDEDDGGWQFHTLAGPPAEEEARVVSLREIVQLDPSIAELSDLRLGWCACREQAGAPWQCCPKGEHPSEA